MRFLGVWLVIWGAVLSVFATAARAEDARVLPKGRHRFSYTFAATQEIKTMYNGSGGIRRIGDGLELNSSNLSKLAPELQKLTGLLNNSDSNAGNRLTAGVLDFEAKAYRQTHVIMEQYGLTDRLSIGFQIPIVRSQVRVKKSLSGTNNAKHLAKELTPASATEAVDGLNKIGGISVQSLEAELAKLGYAPVSSVDQHTGVGDVAFGGRYAYLQGGTVTSSVQLGVTAPTGYVPPPSELTSLAYGEGAWDAGAAHIFNWDATSWLTLGQGLHYTYKFANTQRARVPAHEGDYLPGADKERTVTRKLGDKIWATASLDFKPTKQLTIGAGYEWYWRLADRYSETDGREIKTMTYALVGPPPGTRYLETLTIQLSYSTIDLFLRNQFPVPAQFMVSYNHPTRGRNNPIVNYGTAEVAVFF